MVKTRIAPSPTGNMHIGTARAALFNFLYARQNEGVFIVRIEDTDKERSKKEFEENILQGLEWLGISGDEVYRQSENIERHTEVLKKLLESGAAHEAEENEDGTGRVIRLKNPNKKITFQDLVRGEVTFDTTELGDMVIARDVTSPLYHLAVVVDDYDEEITHVIRGEDHISNTPRQILVQEALGFERPVYAHLPLILAPDKSRLSKRHGAVSVVDFREQGFLPEAVLNYMALLGWHPQGDREIFTLEELINIFDIKRVQKGGAVFSEEKLRWVNKQHLLKKSLPEQEKIISEVLDIDDTRIVEKATPIIFERIETVGDLRVMDKEGEYDYLKEDPEISDSEKLIWKKSTKEDARQHLSHVKSLIENGSDNEFEHVIDTEVFNYAQEKGKGDVLWPLRFALSGKEKSPGPFDLAKILGKEATLRRINNALSVLS